MSSEMVRPQLEDVKKALMVYGGPDMIHVDYGARQYLNGWDAGREAGRAEAQRYLRLMLGIEPPSPFEAAYWNCPMPLMKGPWS